MLLKGLCNLRQLIFCVFNWILFNILLLFASSSAFLFPGYLLLVCVFFTVDTTTTTVPLLPYTSVSQWAKHECNMCTFNCNVPFTLNPQTNGRKRNIVGLGGCWLLSTNQPAASASAVILNLSYLKKYRSVECQINKLVEARHI